MHSAVAALGCLVVLIVLGFGVRSLFHWFYTKDTGLPSLVTSIQNDIKTIDSKKGETGWEVEEAEVEVNFVVKDSSNNKTDLKAVTSEIGSEREDSHRLLLKLHRVSVVVGKQETTPDSSVVRPAGNPETKKRKDWQRTSVGPDNLW